MTNIKMTQDNGWAIEGGNLAFVEGQEEIAQIVKLRLQSFFGEWFLDTTRGVPYFTTIYEKKVDPSTIDNTFIGVITSTPGIISLIEYDSILDTRLRTLTITFKARTVNGVINFSEVVQ